jgi:hypothetical protein
MVAGDEQTLLAVAHGDGKAGRIGDILKLRAAKFPGGNLDARRQRQESVGSNASIFKGVDRDTVAGAPLLLAEGIGERGYGSENVFAVETEGQAEEVGLVGFAAEAIVGKVGELVGFQIEDGERLFLSRSIGAEATVKKNGEAAIGREGDGGWKIIGWARVAGNVGEELAVGELGGVRRILRPKRQSKDEDDRKKEMGETAKMVVHGGG